MNQDNLKLWLADLRSDKYVQGFGQLEEQSGRLCCLGVLCRTAADAGVEVNRTVDEEDNVRYDGLSTLPPDVVWQWLGRTARDGVEENLPVTVRVPVFDMPGGYLVTELNDKYDFTFEQIADAVEATYLRGDGGE